MKRFAAVVFIVCSAVLQTSLVAQESVRQWTDSTGRFKITATLIEAVDGNVLLKNTAGKMIRIPITRLSKQDQEFLKGGDNPFEMVDAAAGTSGADGDVSAADPAALWSSPHTVNWDDAQQFTTLAGVQWQLPDSDGALGFEPKRAPLMKKSSFHESLRPLAINTVSKRAVVGATVSFGVPKPASRLALVDLVSGKAVHAEPVEAHMRPLALLDSGSTVLMVGASDERDRYEKKSELQLWRFDGKKIVRSPSWTPYANENSRGGGDALVADAQVLSSNKVFTISDKGHLVLWDLPARKPLWHARLSERNFAMQLSADRKLLAVFDEKTLMVLNPETAEILGSTALAPNTATGWCRVAWSPSGQRLLLTSIADVRVMDVKTGQWIYDFTLPGGPVATKALSYPHEDFVLLDNRLLVDLDSKIQVCEYRDAGQIETIGGTSFIALQSDAGGVLVPAKFPHPAAEEMLAKAQSDPSMFLLHPGVSVAIDVSAVSGPHQQAARAGLEKSAAASGYKVSPSSPIKVVASITGPKQEAISYIAAGSYVVNTYTSTIQLEWQGQTLWKTSGTNVPGVLMTKRGQTMQQALEEAGKEPNTAMFASARFPEFMQKPSEGAAAGGRPSTALMSSQFTLQGLVDSK